MELLKEDIQKFKDLVEKKEGKEISWEEASEGAYKLAGYVELCFESWKTDQRRKRRLEESPKGFHLEGIGYSCFICGNHISNEETWYDKHGIKCLTCQKAIDKKIIPASAASNKDSWYSRYDLNSCFSLNRHAVNKFIKNGILKPRIVHGLTGKPHEYLFLIKDNADTLPPKSLVKSQLVKETKDGKDWYHSEPWYRFVDPHKHLKGYKIMDYLRAVPADDSTIK